jgi:hypothetical protein
VVWGSSPESFGAITAPANAVYAPCRGTCNDDSCDIAAGGAPAATLFLPYFEVDIGPDSGRGRTTLFSVTNVNPYPQIARVTLWTDWGFPVFVFNLSLTGYDVQPINLYDVIARGVIAGTCDREHQREMIPEPLAADIRALLTTGRSTGASISCAVKGQGQEAQVGGNHGGKVAIGYITIDVVARCSNTLPIDPHYFTDEILFDNVLVGDYQDISQSATAGNYAGGNSMVHIRAIPEGGAAGAASVLTNLPFTFYDRYSPASSRTFDRRQPLPSAFAARWISGSGAAFDTQYKIWREGFATGTSGRLAACTDYVVNSAIPLVEVIRFDEHENAGVAGSGFIGYPSISSPTTPASSRFPISSSVFPTVAGSRDLGGWTYFNLSNGGDVAAFSNFDERPYKSARPGFGWGIGTLEGFPRDVSQNWVIVSMFSEGRYGSDNDAAWLGNGCSPALLPTSMGVVGDARGRIGPAGGVLVCPKMEMGSTQCMGMNTTP